MMTARTVLTLNTTTVNRVRLGQVAVEAELAASATRKIGANTMKPTDSAANSDMQQAEQPHDRGCSLIAGIESLGARFRK